MVATAPAPTLRERRLATLEETIETSLQKLELDLASGHSQAFLDVLRWWATFHRYSFNNAMLIKRQFPTARLVAGIKRWNEMGFTIRRGAEAIFIRGPWLKKEVDPQTGEVEQRLIGYLPLAVFDIAQTNEYPEKQPPALTRPLPGEDAAWAEVYLQTMIRICLTGILVTEGAMPPEVHGMAWKDRICINAGLSHSERLLALIHEWIHHLAGHTERRGETRVADRELVCEATTYVVCASLGIEHPYARDYLLSYEVDLETFRGSLERISQLSRVAHRELEGVTDAA